MSHDPDNIHLPAMPLPPGLPPDDDFPCCSQPAPSCSKSGSNELLTASEVKVLTETASKVAYALGRKDAGEEIAEGIEAVRDAVKLFPIENLDDLLTMHDAWTNAAQIARDLTSQPPEAASDATSGVPGHPEVSEAVRSPQEPCEDLEGNAP